MVVNSKNGVYIGDPHLALSDYYYNNEWCIKYKFNAGEYTFDGNNFIVAETACRDGFFNSDDGHEFRIEIGYLSIIDLALCDTEKLKEVERNQSGLIIKEPGCYTMDVDEGIFYFTTGGKFFSVNTNYEENDFNKDEYDESQQIKLNDISKIKESEKVEKHDNRLSLRENKDTAWLSGYYTLSEIKNNKNTTKKLLKEALEKIKETWQFNINDKQMKNAVNKFYNLLMEENISNSAWGEE